ncbi:MAG: ATP-binding protein [Deltaproteobacteria bacterium]|nr:ATP-binding protein [Deltaproteobacteria bacterium]
MKRDIYQKLSDWKSSRRRKPLLLQGARQTGKTYIIKAFGNNEYENVVYCNFEEDPGLDAFFQRDLNPERILTDLSIYYNHEIRPDADLLVFDEIQTSNRALNALKYFEEKRNDVHIMAAGSLLGVKLSAPGSFPVGKVNFLYLFPMTFMEFLDGMGESRYRQLLENVNEPIPLSESFHAYLIDLLRKYYFIGGMPEAVKHFVETGNGAETRQIQEEIIKSYIMDFAKHAPVFDMPKLTRIWDSIPRHLAKENKKFIFSAVKKGARAREYENALTWLEDAGLIHRATALEAVKHPLKHYADSGCFKVYAMDVGLLGAMSRSPVELLAHGDRLFNEYEGAFVENYVAQQLMSHSQPSLYYWRSKGGKAELDFLCEFGGRIYPLEVKAGINPRSKSLRSYDLQFAPPTLVRTTLLNFKKDGKILNLPLYALSTLSKFIT